MGHKTTETKYKLKVYKTITSRTDCLYHVCRTALIIGLPITIISGLVLSHLSYHSSASSNTSTDNLTLSIPVSCTLSASIKSGEEHVISIVSGQYEADVGKTTLNTICNDPNGYVVYAIGSSNNTEGDNKLKAINLSDNNDIISGTATSGDTSNWAMKLTALDSGIYTPTIDNNYDSYSVVPTTWTKVAHKSPSTTDTTKDSAFTTTYAIYLDSTQPAGIYRSQVKYVMLHPSTAAQPTDTLEHAFALAGKTKVNIYDNNGTNSTNSSTGELIGSFYKMQDMETSICESTTLVDEQNTLQLVDIRDNKLYWVTKLQDGHCWMTQNLDLDLSSSVALTSETTDLNNGSLTGAYSNGYSVNNGTISWTPANTTYDYVNGTGISWAGNNYVAYSLNPGIWYWNANDDAPSCNYLTATCEDFSQTPYSNNGTHGAVGNYYNWSAAIASNDSFSLTTSTYGNIYVNPQNSICPKGWRLPTISNQKNVANSTNEFSRINSLYGRAGDIGLISTPLYFTRGGYFPYNAILNNSGSRGYYWSSTVGQGYYAYYMTFSKTNVTTNTSSDTGLSARDGGWSIRCLAR